MTFRLSMAEESGAAKQRHKRERKEFRHLDFLLREADQVSAWRVLRNAISLRSVRDKAPIRLTGLMGAKKAKFISVAIVSQVPPQESTPAWPKQFLR